MASFIDALRPQPQVIPDTCRNMPLLARLFEYREVPVTIVLTPSRDGVWTPFIQCMYSGRCGADCGKRKFYDIRNADPRLA